MDGWMESSCIIMTFILVANILSGIEHRCSAAAILPSPHSVKVCAPL